MSYFETNTNIDIIIFTISKSIPISISKMLHFDIDINIETVITTFWPIFRNDTNIETNILLNKYLKNSSKMLSNLQMLEFRNQYQYQYWTWGHFETNINIDIALEVISKPITKSKFSYPKIATEIDTISIFSRYFDIKTNIVFKTNHFRTPLGHSSGNGKKTDFFLYFV